MDRNYIRIDTLSFSSIELYMLIFLFVVYIYILIKFDTSFSIKLICMYILALPYTDIVYRFMGVQVSEMIIFWIIINDIIHKKIRLSKNPLCCFMGGFSIILCTSTVFSLIHGMYENKIYGEDLTPINSILNNFRFLMLIYVVNKIIVEVNTEKRLNLVLNILRFSGNITAFTTIVQAVMYKMGFYVPGIFEMWGIPRAKGLSHEPATNAFVLLTTIAISTFYVTERKYVVYKKSLIFQLTAFMICFSSGAIPILCVYGIAFLIFLKKEGRITINVAQKIMLLLLVGTCLLLCLLRTEVGEKAIGNLVQKVSSILSDYINGTDISGRGSDIQGVKMVMEQDAIWGIGSFNSTIFLEIASTNTYFVLLIELGIGGIVLFLPLLFLYIRYFVKKMKSIIGKNIYANEMAFLIIAFISIAWLRVLFFHQIWMVFALGFAAINIERDKEKHNMKEVLTTD